MEVVGNGQLDEDRFVDSEKVYMVQEGSKEQRVDHWHETLPQSQPAHQEDGE